MADTSPDETEEEAEVVTLTASHECGHFRAEVIIQFRESDDPRYEMKAMENLSNGLAAASGLPPRPRPDFHVHEFSQVLEAPTPESIDAAVEQFRVQLQKHLSEHNEGRDDDSTGLPEE